MTTSERICRYHYWVFSLVVLSILLSCTESLITSSHDDSIKRRYIFNSIATQEDQTCTNTVSSLRGKDTQLYASTTGASESISENNNNSSSEKQQSSSSRKKSNKTTLTTQEPEKTLYEILQVNPLATRTEIKRQYFNLAKQSHPDAQIGKVMDNSDSTTIDFQEIANAWRILGNSKLRRRYDLEIKAKEWSRRAQQFTNEKLELAMPVALDMVDNFAVPFIQHTTATTFAFTQAIATGFANTNYNKRDEQKMTPTTIPTQTNGFDNATGTANNAVDAVNAAVNTYGTSNDKDSGATSLNSSTDAFMNVVKTGHFIGKQIINSVELNDKSHELEQRLKEEEERATKINNELNTIKEQRLFATIQSDDIALSSNEAKEVLEQLHIEESKSIVDRALLRHTIEEDIECLHETELKFTEKLQQYEQTDRQWNDLLKHEEESKQVLSARKNQELQARKAYEVAQQQVNQAKEELVQTSNELRNVENQVRKSAHEMDRVTASLSKKQERVRNALRRKTELLKGGIQIQYLSEDDLTALRKKEVQLIGESKEIANRVARLQSRASKLKNRADRLKQWQNTENAKS